MKESLVEIGLGYVAVELGVAQGNWAFVAFRLQVDPEKRLCHRWSSDCSAHEKAHDPNPQSGPIMTLIAQTSAPVYFRSFFTLLSRTVWSKLEI